MIRRLTGIVHGKTIELEEDLGLTDGDVVQVVIESDPSMPRKCGDGLKRWCDAIANDWTKEDDKILDEIYQSRQNDSRPELL